MVRSRVPRTHDASIRMYRSEGRRRQCRDDRAPLFSSKERRSVVPGTPKPRSRRIA